MTSPADDDPFTDFRRAMSEVDPQLELLEGPATPEQLTEAERALQVTLPPLFRRFLLTWNGGTAHDTSVFGVGALEDDLDLVGFNERARREELPTHLLAFASAPSGDVYCFDLSDRDEDGESPVVLLDVEDGQVYPVSISFDDWLEQLPHLEQEPPEQRGPQPMSVPEWEAFLCREREKLRRLSRTPARELSMPDPEKVRADLGGKIPVDPRHLKPKQ